MYYSLLYAHHPHLYLLHFYLVAWYLLFVTTLGFSITWFPDTWHFLHLYFFGKGDENKLY